MAKKKAKEISLDDLEDELGEELDEIDEEPTEETEEIEEEIEEIDEFSLDEVSEEDEISEVFEEEIEGEEDYEVMAPPEEEIIDERVYIVPLAQARRGPRNKYAKKSIRFLREYLTRHFKPDGLVISQEVNEAIWSRGIQKPPRKLKVRCTKNTDGLVVAYLG